MLRVDTGGAGSRVVHGAATIAAQASAYRSDGQVGFAVVNGGLGLVARTGGRTTGVLAFTVVDGLIVEVDILADPDRLAELGI